MTRSTINPVVDWGRRGRLVPYFTNWLEGGGASLYCSISS